MGEYERVQHPEQIEEPSVLLDTHLAVWSSICLSAECHYSCRLWIQSVDLLLFTQGQSWVLSQSVSLSVPPLYCVQTLWCRTFLCLLYTPPLQRNLYNTERTTIISYSINTFTSLRLHMYLLVLVLENTMKQPSSDVKIKKKEKLKGILCSH